MENVLISKKSKGLFSRLYVLSPRILFFLTRIPVKIFFKVFCHLKIEGTENLRNLPKGLIFAANHTSELDPILMTLIFPLFSKHLPLFFTSREKEFYVSSGWRKPIYGGLFFKAWGAYPVKPGLHNYEKSLKNHIQILEDGYSVCIFPEGKRSIDGKIGEAKGGVAFLAETTASLIVPVSITGARNVGLKEILSFQTKIILKIAKPINNSIVLSNEVFSKKSSAWSSDLYKVKAQLIMQEVEKLS